MNAAPHRTPASRQSKPALRLFANSSVHEIRKILIAKDLRRLRGGSPHQCNCSRKIADRPEKIMRQSKQIGRMIAAV
jgi:hypothetical protein